MCLLFLVASTSALPVEPSVVYVCVCKGKICLLFLVALTSALPVEPSDVYVCVCKGKKHVCMYLMRNINTLSVLNCLPK